MHDRLVSGRIDALHQCFLFFFFFFLCCFLLELLFAREV